MNPSHILIDNPFINLDITEISLAVILRPEVYDLKLP